MAAPATMRLGLRLTAHRPGIITIQPNSFFTPSTAASKRGLSSAAIFQSTHPRLARSKCSVLALSPLTATSTPSSFFTPSLCRVRHASTAAASDPTPVTRASASSPPASSVVMDWNNFFQLRTSRRRYSLLSSALGTLISTAGTMFVLVEYQDQAETILKLIPTDPFVSTGIAVVAASFLGWLIAPVFGNGLWRLLHRKGLSEFTIKEKAFFERIRKHRVNPSGAGANNPVPDFYGEKIGSVSGYRRWLKDQRAFNRKRGGNFPVTL